MKLHHFSLTFLTFCLALVSGPKVVEAASISTVADGLNNPSDITFGPEGDLYVTEKGSGGDGTSVSSPSAAGQSLQYGTSGAVTKIENGEKERVLTDYPSLAQTNQTYGAGPQDLQFDSEGNPYLLMGYAGNPQVRNTELDIPDQPRAGELGTLGSVDFEDNSYTEIADLAQYELQNNPDGGDVISNPYSLVIENGTARVTDAGANDQLNVGLDEGNINLETVYPEQTIEDPQFPEDTSNLPPVAQGEGPPEQFDVQSVPTGSTVGPDGALYVSELTGFPYPNNEAKIYRIGADGERTVYAEGFTQLTDVAFDDQGNLYALEYATEPQFEGDFTSRLVKVAPDGTRSSIKGNGLFASGALAMGPNDEDLYISNRSAFPEGEVLRVNNAATIPEPSSVAGTLAFGVFGAGLWLKRKRKQLPQDSSN
ncbi:MAG: ScyD/ScyE family protein [Cyanobacteria bacterium QH_2_48_84]|nr:MAG: ScyD/ScyE family protein [Cyanobacteria bacterium QH_2_48_84]